jgi:hypothetical protein
MPQNLQENDDIYQRIIVDNTKCQRRFHIGFEKNAPLQSHTSIHCPYCDIELFHKENHPEVFLLREENLIQKPDSSADNTMTNCFFQ